MKFLVVGLGSMGKRRIRCLKALGYGDISGYDIRADRRNELRELQHIKIYDAFETIDLSPISALIICTPPDLHNYYLSYAIDNDIPAFVEASVLAGHVNEVASRIQSKDLFIAPSCTLCFHPIIKTIKEIVHSGVYGKITNFSYHSGQFLPDWHPWEKVSEFYVSKRETGGGREIVPFELTWITDTFGFPEEIKGYFSKTLDTGAQIEDTYAFTLKYSLFLGSLIVDVASRFATRNLILNFEKGQLIWNWNDSFFKVWDANKKEWNQFDQPEGKSEAGYNKNIIEEMYIDEIDAFIKGIHHREKYPNSLEKDIRVLELLNEIEQSDGGF